MSMVQIICFPSEGMNVGLLMFNFVMFTA